ncbi:hypothetical protein H6G00_01430 [Leptolyngbya sp. FACHB-541]|uniref:hypothetical protein n=1 Tax=Leptolyngbya sp. FACHB-541 TaxID=2692810 RepID=UPI001689022E|nr:hypothetical protein [Leptolyngbya sp. FACHB-541]MBD1995291.1 hypothetical protein [Leptolyngbya sp. FACHB-541]
MSLNPAFDESFRADFAHQPDPDEPFTIWTKDTQAAVLDLPRSAILLWQDLLRNTVAGVKQIVNLQEIAERISCGYGSRKGKGYHLETMRQAIKKLAEKSLVKIVHDFRGGMMQVVAFHCGPIKPLGDRSRKKIRRSPTGINEPQRKLRNSKKSLNSQPESLTGQTSGSLQISLNFPDLSQPFSSESVTGEKVEVPEVEQESPVVENGGGKGSQKTLVKSATSEGDRGSAPADEFENFGNSGNSGNTTETGFQKFWQNYCGTKAGRKGDVDLARAAYLHLGFEGWNDASLLELFQWDFGDRQRQAASDPNGFYESFPHASNYLKTGYLQGVQSRQAEAIAAQPSPQPAEGKPDPHPQTQNSKPEFDLVFYAKLITAGLVEEVAPEYLPEQMGEIQVRLLRVWNDSQYGFDLSPIRVLRQIHSDSDLDALTHRRSLWELAEGFLREAERGFESDCDEQIDVGLAGLREAYQQGDDWIREAIATWTEAKPGLYLTELGPEQEF